MIGYMKPHSLNSPRRENVQMYLSDRLTYQFRRGDTSYSDDCGCPDLSVTPGQGQECKDQDCFKPIDLVRVVDKYHACPPTFNAGTLSAVQE